MGEYKYSINHHYARKNIDALNRIANDPTVDDDDREYARELEYKLKVKIRNQKENDFER